MFVTYFGKVLLKFQNKILDETSAKVAFLSGVSFVDPIIQGSFKINYSTPLGGMGVGWNFKKMDPTFRHPNPRPIFWTHHYFCTEKECIQIMILSILGILGETVKLSSCTCLVPLVPQINFSIEWDVGVGD